MGVSDTAMVLRAGWGHMMNGCGMTGRGGGFMMIFWIVLLALVVYLVVRAARGENVLSAKSSQGDSALDILKKRYAAGEITKEEFEEKKRDMQ